MRTTINIDEELLAKAGKMAGPLDRSTLVHEGLRALIQRESARRLARLGGSQPAIAVAPRRRAKHHVKYLLFVENRGVVMRGTKNNQHSERRQSVGQHNEYPLHILAIAVIHGRFWRGAGREP